MAINNYYANRIVKLDQLAASIADGIHVCSGRGLKKRGGWGVER